MIEYKLESKNSFREKIDDYFSGVTKGKVPEELLNAVCEQVTEYQYDQNKRFWFQYPKSRKRYSKLKIEDLEHPFVQYLITNYLKQFSEYRKYAKIFLQLTDEELDTYETRKYEYENK